jgi:hypothetical protein
MAKSLKKGSSDFLDCRHNDFFITIQARLGIPQTKGVLTEAMAKFPKEYLIAYNLACYEFQLGNRSHSFHRFFLLLIFVGVLCLNNFLEQYKNKRMTPHGLSPLSGMAS